MVVHVVWELVLLVAVAGLAIYFQRTHRAGVSGAGLRDLLLTAASLGFVTLGVGLSLRAAVVNLAVGPISVAAGLFLATHSDRGLTQTVGIVVLMAAAVGVVIAVLVVAFHVPGWAASLGVAFGVVVWIQKHTGSTKVTTTYHADKQAFYWYGAFAALALLGGILGLVKPIRRGVGRFRPVGDPATRRGSVGAVMAFVAIVGGSVLAAVGGVLAALSSTAVAPVDGFVTTGLALGAALAAGTSAYGRRGGVLGTLLSVTLITLIIKYGAAANLKISPYAVAAAAIAAGLVVTRLVETYGRPRSRPRSVGVTDWDDSLPAGNSREVDSAATNWSTPPRQGGWTSQLPARSTDDTWGGASDDRWGVK
jgi:ribose/xylose/arabinose/galactoside ABC-type transport system permease subunit